jgi:DNA mismatch repair protein MutS2
MQFRVGDEVHVAAFGKGVVREARNGDRYLVELKGRRMVVPASGLRPVELPKSRRSPIAPVPVAPDVRPQSPHASATLDLHGMTVDMAVAAMDAFLNDAILAGHAEVRVIHGRSGGRLKAAVHRRLKTLGAVRSFRLDPANPGVTFVTF